MSIPIGTSVIVKRQSWFEGRPYTIMGFVVAFIPQGETPSSVYPKCHCLAYSQLHNVPVPNDRYLVEFRWEVRGEETYYDYSALKAEWLTPASEEEIEKRRATSILQYLPPEPINFGLRKPR